MNSDLETIKFESKIKIQNIPLEWIPSFELFYPDLPQFPIVYIHLINNGERVYGFPISTSFSIQNEEECEVEFFFLSNKDLENNQQLKNSIKEELEERFGVIEKIGLDDIVSCCNSNVEYEIFFKEIWNYLKGVYGDYIPYGRFYEEIISIIRFVSAWQPRTGRQSEMRMLYNFLSTFGEAIKISEKWNWLHFFLLPTYEDLKNKNFKLFPKFDEIFQTMEKVWKYFYTKEIRIADQVFYSMEKAWPEQKDKFIKEISIPLENKGILTLSQRHALERLIDVFNRHSWRTAFFIYSIMISFIKDYETWDKKFFTKFYLGNIGIGSSEKVIACFLQQGFRNSEVIPIDIWIDSFRIGALGIENLEQFFNTFSNLGKLERVMWKVSQAKKTNIKKFFNMLWCIRFGDTGNNELRGSNPIACYECVLLKKCPSYVKIKNSKVLLEDAENTEILPYLTKKKKNFKGMKIKQESPIIKVAENNKCLFICITQEGVPKKIFKERGQKPKMWKLIDEFSGFLLSYQKINREKLENLYKPINKIDKFLGSDSKEKDYMIVTVENLIKSLPSFINE